MTTLNFNELVLNKGYFTKSEEFGYLVFSNEGSFELKNESMEFKTPSNEDVFVEYDIHVDGSIDDEGYALVGSQEITVTKVYVGEDQVILSNESDIIKLLKSEIY
jgi:hypothetical protein